MNILISAYTAVPGAGSEPGAGWMWARAAGTVHDVWVLTRTEDEPYVRAGLAAEPELRIRPVFLDLPRRLRGWHRGLRGMRLHYLLWQSLAAREARRLHAQVGFDVAHHLTFAVDWMPAGVSTLPVPFVWGPVGGTTGMTTGLWPWLSWRARAVELFRELGTGSARWLFGDRVARRADLIVAQNHDVAQRFARHGEVVVEPHVALEHDTFEDGRRERASSDRRTALFVGRLLGWKGILLALAAMQHLPDWTLDVYGDGPERASAEARSHRLGLTDRVRFHGNRPRTEVLRAFLRADAFLFPSMHDAAGWVVAEALGAGCPVICLDRGGPATMVRQAGVGAAVPVGPDLDRRLAAALSAVEGRVQPVRRWDAERLPGLASSWYERVINRA